MFCSLAGARRSAGAERGVPEATRGEAARSVPLFVRVPAMNTFTLMPRCDIGKNHMLCSNMLWDGCSSGHFNNSVMHAWTGAPTMILNVML